MNPTEKAFAVGFIYPLGKSALQKFFSNFSTLVPLIVLPLMVLPGTTA
jgi:hypothetical protein